MREIKFRAYDKSWEDEEYSGMRCDIIDLEFIDGELTGVYIDGDYFDIKNVEIMQYTGLKDKNGKEIYEGDIVKIIVNNNIEKTCLVEYKNGIFGVMFDKQVELTAFPHFHNTTFEVIGNIYENPQLLED